MDYVADFHLHSKYSRAVSKDMDLPQMAKAAQQKGLDILTASDWTHTLWLKEIRAQLEEATEGLYCLKSEIRNPKSETKEPLFILSTEISSIYSEKGKLRRIHNLVFAPNLEIAEKIQKELLKRGANLSADGRPIIGISSKNLFQLILEIDERCMLIPCHAWTPHFGIYGSASGYDSLEEAFEDLTPYIYGIETGLSSDPEMNWQIPELMNRSILSFSDAHSLPKMGREATVFELAEASYENIRRAIMRKKVQRPVIASGAKQSNPEGIATSQAPRNDNRIKYTVEFYPEEGKYHFSGHRNCGVVRGPEELKKEGDICPICKRRLTEGVLFRVQQLCDKELLDRLEVKISPREIKWYTDKRKNHPPFVKLVPLLEIVAESLESTVFSVKTKGLYKQLTLELGSEIEILLKVPIEDISKIGGSKIAHGILLVRKGDIVIDPGFDGEYGKVKIWKHEEISKDSKVSEVSRRETEKKEQLGIEF